LTDGLALVFFPDIKTIEERTTIPTSLAVTDLSSVFVLEVKLEVYSRNFFVYSKTLQFHCEQKP